MESDAESLPFVDLDRVAHEPPPGLVPDERVSAAQDREGRQAVELGGQP